MIAPQALPAAIRSYLGEFIVRRRRLGLVCRAGHAFVVFGLWMLVWCSVDRIFHLPSIARGILLAMGILATGYLLARAVGRWLKLPDWVAVARQAELTDPRFGQKLITVTSQILARPDHRGSDQILVRLSDEVVAELEARPHPRHHHGARQALVPWAACLVLAAGLLTMSRLPGLRFGQLALRFVAPMADVPEVTTTQLEVSPGNSDVVQSQPVTIEARARQLGDSSLTVFLSDNQRDWSAATMTPTGVGVFSFTIQSVDRDLRYYVSGGDARSPSYSVRVLRRPAVSRFAIRYAYPPYTRLGPATITNEDGRIEAPVGTHVSVTVSATEPLMDAVVRFENRKLPTSPTADLASRKAEWDVTTSGSYDVELTSARNVAGSGPAGCLVRALPDLPPQVRLLRGGESLSQAPRQIVPISYEALDDYAVASLTLRSQLNGDSPTFTSFKLWGDARRQQDIYDFDLALVANVGIGDVITINLIATDSGGHEVTSSPLQILVSPRTVDLATYQRIVELGRAVQLSRTLASALNEASRAQGQMPGAGDRRAVGFQSLGSRADRALSGASQTAGLLRQSLLKAITHKPNASLSIALSNWVDEAEVLSSAAQEAFRQSGLAGGIGESGRQALSAACTRADSLADELDAASRGEQAEAVLSDLNNLAVVQKGTTARIPKTSQRLVETLERMRQEITAEARQLGLDASAPDLAARLTQIRMTGQTVAAARSLRPVDFAAEVSHWASEIRVNPQQRLGMDARLTAAAQAEAIQPDADLTRARDLDLASRAAYAVVAAVRGAQPTAAASLKAFVSDTSVLLSGPGHPTELHPPDTQPAMHARWEAARSDLLRLSGGGESSSTTRPNQAAGDLQKEIEDLAMQANAAAAARHYGRAAELEATLNRKLRSRPRRDRFGTTGPATAPSESDNSPSGERLEHHRLAAEREMNSARKVDDLDQRQYQLANRLASGDRAAGLVQQQQSVADEIDTVRSHRDPGAGSEVDQPDGRERATAEALAAIEQLANMPQSLAEAQSFATARRSAARRAQAAESAAKAAAPDQLEAAKRAALEADSTLRDASDRLTGAIRPLRLAIVRYLAQRLGSYSPETDSACDVIDNRLIPTLEALPEALAGEDAESGDRAAGDTREAIAATQRELASARDLLVRRDPLAAARWFARAAAESLSASPPDVGGAKRHQAGVFESLSRAWDQSIHRAASQRLSVVPSMSAVLGPPSPNGRGGQGSQSSNPFASAQEWGRLRDETAGLDPSLHDSEPAGYEQPLKLYFEALGRAGEAK